LGEHGLNVCADLPQTSDDMDEIVYGIEGTDGDPLFLYLFYEPLDSEHKIEFYAEIVNEDELHDLMDEADVGEHEDDDDELEEGYDDDSRDEDRIEKYHD
jgi:hypothetical protein